MYGFIRHWVQSLVVLALLLAGSGPAFAVVCDVDNDGNVDRVDINLIFAARNQPATGPDDPRDADGNGTINVLDGRKCTLQCTLANCASPTPNTPPNANAGPDQTGQVGSTITLNGAASSDADGDPLSFAWSFVQRPASSTAVLDNPTAVSPRFVIDESGDYRIQLIVNDGNVNSLPDEVLVTTQNSAPVANAGPDQGLTVGATVSLNGAGSSDPDGDPLTFAWTFSSKPAGSAAVLSNPALVNPQFVADLPGSYVVDLVVNDGSVDSAPDQVVISSGNTAPVANAGPDQTVAAGSTVTLNGAGSSDAEGQPLTYAWSLTSKPSGSAAVLSNPNAVNPGFTADLPGTYVAQLVVNDGFVNSLPDTVQISTSNTTPVANAGPDQTVAAGATVQLNGAGSTDADGNPLTYQWSFTSRPAGSTATLSSPTAVNPTFTADLPGDYFLQLVVNDGIVNSSPDTVRISTTNTAPVANAGPDQTVVAGANVQLNGAGSTDVDGNPITYQWSFTSRPPGSNAALSSATVVNPTFTADVLGDYFLQLVVNDGFVNSLPDTVQISTTNSAPVANAGPDQTVPIGSTVQLDGSGSSDADNHALTYAWSLTTKPTGSTATLSATNITNPSFVADLPGMYVAQLTVNDGFVDSPVDTVQVSTINSVPVANAGSDQSVLPGAVVNLDGSGSSDADGESLTYQWAILSAPAGSTAALSDPTARNPTLGSAALPLLVGTYVLQLIVNDGHVDSAPDTMTIQVGGSVSLSLIGTQVVGVTRDATVRATLPQAAPAGGVTVTVTSDNAGILAVTAPGTVAIPEGQTAGDVTVHGIAPGTAGLRGNATGYGEGVLDVTVTLNLISMPTTLNVPLGRTANLPVTIAPDPAPAGGVVVSVVSSDPARVRVDTPTVTIPAGQLSANATVFGAGVGGATVNGSNPNYAADVTSATTTATVNIVEGNQTINRSFGGQITLRLESPPGTPLAAPAGGVQATLIAANPACLAAAASPVTIGQGLTTTTSAISYGGTATLPCTTTLTVSGAAGITGDSINVTVNPTPGITLIGLPETVGSGLMSNSANVASLGASNHGGVTVRIQSSNPAVALVSPDATTPGAAFFDTFVADGSTNVLFRVHGLEGATGNVTITASAPGFTDRTGSATVAQPALQLSGLVSNTTALSVNSDFRVQVGIPNATNTNLSPVQLLRAGSPGVIATVSNSQAGVARLTTSAGSDQTRLVAISAGQSSSPLGLAAGGVQFDPLAAGSTTVAAGIPGFIATAAASQAVTVTGAGITFIGLPETVGSGLMSNSANVASLGASNHGGVTVRIQSSNPAVALVSPDATTPGAAFFDTFVADGSTNVLFRVHGVEGATGAVTITASAPGFTDGTGSATVVQPALGLSGLVSDTTALSVNSDFRVQVGLPNAGNTVLAEGQPLRAGSPGVIVTVSNSQAGVAQLTTSAGSDQTRTVVIAAGQSVSPSGLAAGGVQFDPLTTGTTTVAAGIPGFIATTAASQNVTVSTPAITMGGLPTTAGSGLMNDNNTFARLEASNHGGVTVRIESSNPAVALVSPNTTTPGAPFFETFVADGFTNVNFSVHGLEGVTGSVTITASAPGFTNGTGEATIAQPALQLINLFTTTDSAANTDFRVRVGLPDAANTNLSRVQPLRPGGPGAVATVSNSEAGVAQLTTLAGSGQVRTVTIAAGQFASPSGLAAGGVQFDPLAAGITTVSADIPGFIATAAASQVVTVNAALASAAFAPSVQPDAGADLAAAGVIGDPPSLLDSAGFEAPQAAENIGRNPSKLVLDRLLQDYCGGMVPQCKALRGPAKKGLRRIRQLDLHGLTPRQYPRLLRQLRHRYRELRAGGFVDWGGS